MTNCEHLTVWDLRLITRGPLHIGCGVTCAKTDYLFDRHTNTVSMIDPESLFAMLYRRGLADQYERFIFSGNSRLDAFLRKNGVPEQEWKSLFQYTVNVEDALDDDHSLKEIHRFVRDPRHCAYVPGSSVKGALRTVILFSMIAREKKAPWPDSYSKAENARQMQNLEGRYLNTLSLKKTHDGQIDNDPVNSILRGLSVSDSEPVAHSSMILVGKSDVNPKGREKRLPLCRECIRPGTELHFRLTLDRSVLPPGFSEKTLLEMIRQFDAYYQRTYLPRFAAPPDAHPVSYQDAVILSGGAGFFSKSLAYPYLGAAQGLGWTERLMSSQFPKHHHDSDSAEHHVSPHTMKYGRYQGELYPYGVCEVRIT